MTGDPEPGPDIHIRSVSAGPDETLVVELDAHLTCTACGYANSTFQVDFSGSIRQRTRRTDTTDHDPGE